MSSLKDFDASSIPVLDDPLFEAAINPDALAFAWGRVRANGGAAGGDQQSIAEFGKDVRRRLDDLHYALRTGRYRPGPLRRVDIPKPDGGTRTLAIPCIVDRIVQTSVTRLLVERCDGWMHPHSFAYRPGRSVAQAASLLVRLRNDGFVHVVDGDIRRFFDALPQRQLCRLLELRFGDARLVRLITAWLPGFSSESHWLRGRFGIAQGSPLSPFLANLSLDAFDWAMDGPGCRLVRYADDFVLACWSRRMAENAMTRAADSLRRIGLDLHPDKSRVTCFQDGFVFLRHKFTDSEIVAMAGGKEEEPEC